jgi:hypothetical protein
MKWLVSLSSQLLQRPRPDQYLYDSVLLDFDRRASTRSLGNVKLQEEIEGVPGEGGAAAKPVAQPPSPPNFASSNLKA